MESSDPDLMESLDPGLREILGLREIFLVAISFLIRMETFTRT